MLPVLAEAGAKSSRCVLHGSLLLSFGIVGPSITHPIVPKSPIFLLAHTHSCLEPCPWAWPRSWWPGLMSCAMWCGAWQCMLFCSAVWWCTHLWLCCCWPLSGALYMGVFWRLVPRSLQEGGAFLALHGCALWGAYFEGLAFRPSEKSLAKSGALPAL